MEDALADVGISVGKIVYDQPRVTPAVLVYCEKLVDYIISLTGSAIWQLQMHNVVSSYPPGQTLLNTLTIANANPRAILYRAIASAINDETIEESQEELVTFGLGRLNGVLEMILSKGLLEGFGSSVVFAVYDCVDQIDIPGRFEDYNDMDFVVDATVERLRIPSDINLIDGMLISENREFVNGALDKCVCLEGVPLWPTADVRINLTQNDEAEEGTFRLQPSEPLVGFLEGVPYTEQHKFYLLFRNPTFLQGLQSMDKILKLDYPSWKNLQIYTNGQWVAAETT